MTRRNWMRSESFLNTESSCYLTLAQEPRSSRGLAVSEAHACLKLEILEDAGSSRVVAQCLPILGEWKAIAPGSRGIRKLAGSKRSSMPPPGLGFPEYRFTSGWIVRHSDKGSQSSPKKANRPSCGVTQRSPSFKGVTLAQPADLTTVGCQSICTGEPSTPISTSIRPIFSPPQIQSQNFKKTFLPSNQRRTPIFQINPKSRRSTLNQF
jgi:hypothetical protein